MSITKRWLEEISEKEGHGGEINNHVLQKAIEFQAREIDKLKEIRREFQCFK